MLKAIGKIIQFGRNLESEDKIRIMVFALRAVYILYSHSQKFPPEVSFDAIKENKLF